MIAEILTILVRSICDHHDVMNELAENLPSTHQVKGKDFFLRAENERGSGEENSTDEENRFTFERRSPWREHCNSRVFDNSARFSSWFRHPPKMSVSVPRP